MTTLLTVRDLTVAYGGLRALDAVDLDCTEGSLLGLIGPNGAGKTTLLECIAGSVRPDTGSILFDGRDITRLGPAAHGRLGIVRSFQDARLFPGLTVHQVLSLAHERARPTRVVPAMLGLPPTRRRERSIAAEADRMAAAFGLTPHVDKLVSELSSGLRRAVDLACATTLAPRMLLLDEPSAGLAQAEVGALAAVIAQVRTATGATIVIVEHDMPLLMGLAEQVAVLDAGRLIAFGPPDVVRRDPGVVAAYGAV